MLANSDKHIFISHSARDLQLVEWFRRRFDGTGVEPRFMEYLSWRKREKPNWSWIKSEIEKSTALMLILSRNIVNREHTQNWVAYEIGVAAANNKYVVVFRDSEAKEEVNFPVPYFNEYWSVPIIELGEWRTVNVAWWVRDVIQGQRTKPNVTCPNCLLAYFYRPAVGEIQCPCCSHLAATFEEAGE